RQDVQGLKKVTDQYIIENILAKKIRVGKSLFW
ncbi:MAG: hypothetical protein G01um101493_368, partial [Microgenomates group bacterium Gr01-1014_93]